MKTREPVVDGQFYPADANALSNQIERYLSEATAFAAPGRLQVLIVPHAGYPYSGPVAAYGFKAVKRNAFDRVVLIGSSHQARFEKITVDGSDAWQTPLDKVLLDKEFIQFLISRSSLITLNSQIHANEHSLEVELPFLQKVLDDFKIVPILLGSKSEEVIQTLADALSETTDSKTLIVISTDLSHYPNYEDAKRVDAKTIEAILSGDANNLKRAIANSMSKNIPNLATCACGEAAVRVGMKVAQSIGADDIRLLKYANSGDTTGDKSRVVGYAAIGFFEQNGEVASFSSRSEKDKERGLKSANSNEGSQPRENPSGWDSETRRVKELAGSLNEKQQQTLLHLARETLEAFVRTGKVQKVTVDEPELQENLGAFVTLRKPEETQDLRGCMGVFEPNDPLWKVIQDRTVAAASKDPRFPPVQPKELADIEIEISVLSKPQKIEDASEIQLGTHGVVLKQGRRGGTFLPQVATETGWDKETFLGHRPFFGDRTNLCPTRLPTAVKTNQNAKTSPVKSSLP